MQKFTTFGRNILKTNILKMQNVVKIETIVITGEYRGATHSICHLTDYTLLTLQELWQAQYQILSITFLKEFIKLSV